MLVVMTFLQSHYVNALIGKHATHLLCKKLCLVKCELSFIGRSDSNHSAFHLYRANSAGFFSTPFHVHVWLLKVCSLCMVMSVPCSCFKKSQFDIVGGPLILSQLHVWTGKSSVKQDVRLPMNFHRNINLIQCSKFREALIILTNY